MKMVKSLLLGTAAGLVAMSGAQAADLPVKAKPVQYVKICSLYGAGFYYIPGTDTCLKIGGFVRAEVNVQAGGSFSVLQTGAVHNAFQSNDEFWRTRAGITADARSQTEYGTLRSYLIVATTEDDGETGVVGATASTAPGTSGGLGVFNNAGGSGRGPYTRLWSNAAFIQLAGFTAGKTASFWDFDNTPYSNQTNFWGGEYGGAGIDVFAYTAQFGNGLSASLSVEQPDSRRMSIVSTNNPTTSPWQYGNNEVPDIVGNLRVDQSWGSAQLMGAYHQLRAVNSGGCCVVVLPETTATGDAFAVGGGVKFNVPMIGAKDYVIVQAAYSDGVLSYVGQGINGGFNLNGDNSLAEHFVGPAVDAVVLPGGSIDKTKAWSVTGGFEHWWNANWHSSLYGAYGKLEYSDAASAVLRPATALLGSSANWNYTQIGSRTVWSPVPNLDLSVEVMYNNLQGAFASGTDTYGNKDWLSGIFRVQRNFYP